MELAIVKNVDLLAAASGMGYIDEILLKYTGNVDKNKFN